MQSSPNSRAGTSARRTKRDLPPLTAAEFAQLRADAQDIPATAKRKNLCLDRWEMACESDAATNHFDLGCWLFFYSRRIHRSDAEGLRSRIDCAKRIFEAGFTRLYYEFHTVFDFGERDFNTLFDSRDSLKAALRPLAQKDPRNPIAEAFRYYGWPIGAQESLFSKQTQNSLFSH